MAELRVGVIGIPGKWSTELLADRLAEQTGYRRVIDAKSIRLDLQSQDLFSGDLDLCSLDGLVVKKISDEYSAGSLNRLELLRIAESRGVRVFSPANALLGLLNRLTCSISLRKTGVPMPATVVTENTDEVAAAVQRYGQAILKPLFSTKARGMQLLDRQQDPAALRATLETFRQENGIFYLQQRLELGGRDFGLVFVGGEFLCGYARVSQENCWNTTIHSGGRYAAFEPDVELIALATRAQSAFQLDFTTVDMAVTETGPVVFEVSAFGGFRGAQEGAGCDAAAAYAAHIVRSLGA